MNRAKKLKILMLEDSEDDATLIERILRKENLEFVTERVDTRDEFTEAIGRFQPDVVLSDHSLPGFNSHEALKICLRERPKTPFILVTGRVSDDFAIMCIRQGADDYILKSNLQRLPMAVQGALKKRKLEKLKREARHALRKQNLELIKVNKELDNFVYSVSHNLRGPLTSVMGLLHLAKRERDISTIDALHLMMETSIARLDETLKEILDFARNARNEIHPDEIDWAGLLEACIAKVEYLDKVGMVTKDIELNAQRPFYSDGERLKTILINLLSNAILFRAHTRKPEVKVSIHTSNKDAIIIVRDNGIGITKHLLPKIFNMFYRGADRSQGAGLGLYITREIVTRLKGTIHITSIEDEGTEVKVVLPNERACTLSETLDEPPPV
ncbi:MAG: hybrid sensor histidine kinase/response regulator [Azospira oryzae]|jgi:signal transduction histidine kinase|nr:MAG: hybrid sensor histidine kinase/response regulator [Azospira oryzae]